MESADEEVAALLEELPDGVPGDGWRVWRDCGELFAWRKKTSPPVLFSGAGKEEVLSGVNRWIAGKFRHPDLPDA